MGDAVLTYGTDVWSEPAGAGYSATIDPILRTRHRIARLIVPLYLPSFLVATGTGMLIPVLPLYLRDVGLSYTLVTTALAAAGLGALMAQLPVGVAVSRYGVLPVMVAAIALIAVAVALLGVTAVTLALIGLRVVAGIGSTAWLLSRHSFIATAIPVAIRGRVSSAFGGVSRAGLLVGPVLGGLVAARWGFDNAFVLTGVVTAIGLGPLLFRHHVVAAGSPVSQVKGAVGRLIRVYRKPLAAVGAVQLGVVATREGRLAVIPLLGAALGLSVGEVGALVAVGSASDLLLFPVAGILMDRAGRVAALVPSLLLLGAGLFLAAAASTTHVLVVAAAIIGVGNGLGAGSMLTIGADLAPRDDPSRFLSVIGATRDAGRVAGPLIVGWMADLVGLSASAVALGVVALITAGFMAIVVGDTRSGLVRSGAD